MREKVNTTEVAPIGFLRRYHQPLSPNAREILIEN